MKLSHEEIQARLAEVRRSYLASLREKREAILTKWAALNEQWDNDTYQSLYIIIHSLAGSAETFGLAEVSRDARKVVDLFKRYSDQQTLDDPITQEITAHIEQLASTIEAGLAKNS